MYKAKVFVTRKWPVQIEHKLTSLFDTTLNEKDNPLSIDELKSAMQHYDAVCPSVCDTLPAEVINVNNRRCKIIGNYGVGFNHIDIQSARRQGVTVTNTPDVLTESTADLAMTLLLMSARRGAEGDRVIRSKQWTGWNPTQMMGSDVTGATLGLIGFGRIARAMAKKAHHGFNMKIIYYNPSPADQHFITEFQATRCDSVGGLLQRSDFVSLHCPGSQSTRHLINRESLELMKPTAHLINTARGDVVDNKALIQALQEQIIAGAGLDVFENEPDIDEGFLKLKTVTLLPHLGSATLSTRINMGEKVLQNLVAFFAGDPIPDRVV